MSSFRFRTGLLRVIDRADPKPVLASEYARLGKQRLAREKRRSESRKP